MHKVQVIVAALLALSVSSYAMAEERSDRVTTPLVDDLCHKTINRFGLATIAMLERSASAEESVSPFLAHPDSRHFRTRH